ncbi:MAG TPA: biosynthetic-type acetolactate synthase large subunit [Longimicrobiales bacterium]|nr:biosynthetic-type acetolactate synthase large subunit [Longimicrobiales bacterium]
MTVADRLCAALVEQGVAVMFGHPGGAILPFYDSLYRQAKLRHILMRHEQAVVHAADGYARASGSVGVCVATSGPGATNLVTGLATAHMDGVPVVAITGQVPRAGRGLDFFQETDVVGVTMPVTKHGFLVDDPADLDDVVRAAFDLARSGRPGPVVIDIPKDVQAAPYAGRRTASRTATPVIEAARPDLERATDMLNRAERPVVMAGRGVLLSGTHAALLELAVAADLPVVTTLLGLDAFPASHRLSLGLPGMHGTERANKAIQRADLILGLGLRFDDRVVGNAAGFAPLAEIIHADIAPSSMGRIVQPTLELIGDLCDTLPALSAAACPARRDEWLKEIEQWSRTCGENGWSPDEHPSRLSGRFAIRRLAARIAETRATVVTDVGQHQMWLAQELGEAVPRSHLTSGGLGTMGYALPAAFGAAVACPERQTWVVAGDGGFQMTLQELATVVQENVPLRIAVINNGFLGMVRQWQELYYDRRYSASAVPGPTCCFSPGHTGFPPA